MKFFANGRIWNTDESELLVSSQWKECHIDTSPEWHRNHYYRTKEGKYFRVTEVEERPGFVASLFGAQIRKQQDRWELLDSANSVAFRIQCDLGPNAKTALILKRPSLAA